MKDFKKSIDKQIELNRDKNLFDDYPGLFTFARETTDAISAIDELPSGAEDFLIGYATDKAIEAFCSVNQYFAFDAASVRDLRTIYADLFDDIRSRPESANDIAQAHYEKLQNWLRQSNPFAEKLYAGAGRHIMPVACAEYEAHLQADILHLDLQNVMTPVLDIGCGPEARLVDHLKKQGIDSYGIDRHPFTVPELTTADWLEYDYGVKKWGTIVSHLGFSNHFNHHHLRADGNFIAYAQTYMKILHSLNVGGSFHYAPDLPFIEKYLDSGQFHTEKYGIDDLDFKATKIKRLA